MLAYFVSLISIVFGASSIDYYDGHSLLSVIFMHFLPYAILGVMAGIYLRRLRSQNVRLRGPWWLACYWGWRGSLPR